MAQMEMMSEQQAHSTNTDTCHVVCLTMHPDNWYGQLCDQRNWLYAHGVSTHDMEWILIDCRPSYIMEWTFTDKHVATLFALRWGSE